MPPTQVLTQYQERATDPKTVRENNPNSTKNINKIRIVAWTDVR